MADETTAETTSEETTDDKSGKQETETTTEQKTDADIEAIAAKANDPDAVRNALTAERTAAREAKEANADLARRIKEFEDRDKSEQEKKDEALKSAEDRAKQAEAGLLRFKVAAAKQLPAELADRLQGKNEKELGEDADRLLELVKPGKATGDVDAGRGEPDEGGSFNDAIRQAARR
jgi:hypothetical protein